MSNEYRYISKSKRDHITILIFLLLFPAVILAIDISNQRVSGNYYSLYNNPIWMEGKTLSQVPLASNDYVTDTSRYLSDYLFLSKVKDGYSLLWDHTTGSGIPFLARWSSRAFSLFSLPFYLLPFLWAIYSSIWFKMVVAGISTYFLAISFGLLPSTGLLVAVIFQTAGPLLYTPIHPMTDILVLFPIYLLVLNKIFCHSPRFWILLSFIIAIMELGGDIQTILLIFAFTVLYIFFMLYLSKSGKQYHFSSILFIILAWIVANGFIAFQLLPFFEWWAHRAKFAENYHPIRFMLRDLAGLFLPKAISSENSKYISVILLCSPGICAILLLPLWLSARHLISKETKDKIELLFFSSIFIFIVLVFFPYLNISLPSPFNFSIVHIGWLIILSTGFIIGLAIESWNLFPPDECRQCLKRLLFIAPIFWLLLFLCFSIGKITNFIGINNFWLEFGLGLLFLLLIIIYLLISLFSPSPRNAGFIISLLFILSLSLLYYPYRPTTPSILFSPNNEIITKLEAYGNRFAGTEDAQNIIFPPSTLTMMVIPKDKCTERYYAFMTQALKEPKLWIRTGTSCFIYTPSPENKMPDSISAIRQEVKLKQIFSSGVAIFQIDSNIGRAYVIYKGKNVDKVLPELLTSDTPHLVENTVIPESGSIPEMPATIETISPTEVHIKVEKTKPGILVLADTYYPGWSVSVDGVAKDIIPVNIAFRGVELSEGDHQIEFVYKCKWLWWGFSITITTLLIALIILRFSFRFSAQLS
ncbi:MAG TPA: YfhO family protein [Candidatus Hydrogenedens sp.]|nr:YfhO family protein [Candidatus Hydrogenedens sp.]HOL20546.1 YfhO family protein [Candidatus Hydrogenedens sp.]